jgi:hypothetical protein
MTPDALKIWADRGWDRYPVITYHRATHKPFLLLSVIKLIAKSRITENFIDPSYADGTAGAFIFLSNCSILS